MSKELTILITGAAGLVGRALADEFIKKGYNVILGVHDKSRIPIIYHELLQKYNKDNFLVHELELTNEESINKLIKASTTKFGKIDVLVNNAAIDAKADKLGDIRFENYPIDIIRKSIETNIVGTIIVTQQVVKQMLKQGYGNIINVSSIYSILAPNQKIYGDNYKPIEYGLTKSILSNFSKYLASLYAKNRIRSNCIILGGIKDNQGPEFIKRFNKLVPMGRMLNIEEIFSAFLFLADPDNCYMTGQDIILDGGYSVV